ncbi:hypothetical protein EVG20_g6192 [Dentipellis fragilis]|uniref:Uncharacterized protein n=1 Tax=Dentipellis fragilis TaxID=205917 RepID=A0A4Y9YPR1_9AGAM|nr:hypothetical protein EVG20_g6192 [Dentipellis fragilis]
MPASGPRPSCDIDLEMAWAPPRALEDGSTGVREKDAVVGGRKAFAKAWMPREEGEEKEVAVSYAYREEKGRHYHRRMTVGSWVAMVVLLALSMWVILAQTLKDGGTRTWQYHHIPQAAKPVPPQSSEKTKCASGRNIIMTRAQCSMLTTAAERVILALALALALDFGVEGGGAHPTDRHFHQAGGGLALGPQPPLGRQETDGRMIARLGARPAAVEHGGGAKRPSTGVATFRAFGRAVVASDRLNIATRVAGQRDRRKRVTWFVPHHVRNRARRDPETHPSVPETAAAHVAAVDDL